jgi:hypothetical protein
MTAPIAGHDRAASLPRHATIVVALGTALLCLSDTAQAGPPLIADDPNTIGAGAALPIVATSVIHRADRTLLRGPILDLTVGAVESLDVTLVASLESQYRSATDPPWQLGGLFVSGLKWRFVSGDEARAAFSPAIGVNTTTPGRPFFLLPVQAEFAIADSVWVLGFDLGYVPVVRNPDQWFIAPYAVASVTRRLILMFELWSLGAGPTEAFDLGASIGVNTRLGQTRLWLLAALGTGFVSLGRDRALARAYLGVQYAFSP